MNQNNLLNRAIEISSKHRLPVFPCALTKRPLTENGFKGASTEIKQIERWFSSSSAELIGVPTGKISGIAVLDIDKAKQEGASDGFTWLKDNEEKLPDTHKVRTQNGGLHLYFKHTDELRSSAGTIAPGVDIRADGGYIIFAGPGYEIINELPLDDLPTFPAFIIEAKADHSPAGPKPAKSITRNLAAIYEPGRWHSTVRDWTASVLARGDSEQTIMEVAPLLTLPNYPEEQTQKELGTFISGAKKKNWQKPKPAIPEFKLKNYQQLLELEDPTFIIQDLLVSDSIVLLYGPTGTYKSTVMIDLCVCLANGLPWHGRETKQSNVAILSHEDGSGFKKRFVAACNLYNITDPEIRWDDHVCNLLDPKEIETYVRELNTHEIDFLVIDTLAYAIAGGEENSAKDMGVAVNNLRQLREGIEGTVMLIHHSGKNLERGARGSSVLKAAVETEIEVTADNTEITLRQTKQRHCARGKAVFLKAETVQVDESTACILHTGRPSTTRNSPDGFSKQTRVAWRMLEELTESYDEVNLEDFFGELKNNSQFTRNQNKQDSFKKAVKRCIKAFETHKMIEVSPEGLISIVNADEMDTYELENNVDDSEEPSD